MRSHSLFFFAFLTLINCLGLQEATAQVNVGTMSSTRQFRQISELDRDSLQLWIKNPYNYDIRLGSLRSYSIFGSKPFTSADTNKLIPANDSVRVKLYFKPVHNISNNSVLVFMNDGRHGPVVLPVSGVCRYSNAYYNNTFGLSEKALKKALKSIVTANYTSLGYNNGRDNMFMTIDNQRTNGQGASVNTLECIYTGRKAVGYTSRQDAQNSSNFNTEHTFPQSLFNSGEPMLSDLFHLYPTTDRPNGSRGNFAFGIATTPYRDVAINASSKLGANNLYMPRDSQKGRTARSMLYFVTRYQDYATFCRPQEAILRQWAKQFPPLAEEQRRNAAIFALQRNRNPFIDYPQFLDRISVAVDTVNNGTSVIGLDLPESAINYGGIQLNVPTEYGFVVVNTGNTILQLTSPTLAGAGFSFTRGSDNNVGLLPGEAKMYYIQALATTSTTLTGTLTLSTNAPIGTIVVPINATGTTSTAKPLAYNFTLPYMKSNPVSGAAVITSKDLAGYQADVLVINTTGQQVLAGTLSFDESGELTLATDNLATGLYQVRLKVGGMVQHLKFIKE